MGSQRNLSSGFTIYLAKIVKKKMSSVLEHLEFGHNCMFSIKINVWKELLCKVQHFYGPKYFLH